MPSYRFCRPDDIPMLVRAIEECFSVYFPGTPPMTVEAFRAEMKELDLWPSNCMVAIQGEEPIAVLTGTKREREVLVRRIGVREDYRRQGHASHLLTSLSQKLAVLGPERLIAEVPLELPATVALVEANGYVRETTYRDWTRPPTPTAPVPDEMAMPVTVAELEAQGALDEAGEPDARGESDAWSRPAGGVSWERTRETLLARRDLLRGAAIAMERIDAYLLYREADDGAVDVYAARARGERRDVLLGLLLRWLATRRPSAELRLPRLAEDELPEPLLESLGFQPGATYARYAAVATPA